MSGVGEALALVSLLVAVAQSYKKVCWQPYSRFRSLPKVVKRYLTHLDNQRVIYEAHCELLLENAVGEDGANTILNEIVPFEWQDDHTGKQVSDLLGRRVEACLRTVKQIETLLEDVYGQTQRLRLLLKQENAERRIINVHRSSILEVKDKLVVAFSKSSLQENLDELTAFNVELSSLCSIQKKSTTANARRSSYTRYLRPFIENVRADRKIAEASQEAFDMLGISCSEHQEHQANLNMLAIWTIDDSSLTSRVELKLALAGGESQREPVWFEMRMLFHEIDGNDASRPGQDAVCNCTSKLKIAEPDPMLELCTKERRGELQIPGISQDAKAAVPAIEAAANNCESRSINQNLCNFLQHCCRQQSPQSPLDLKANNVKWHVSIHPIRSDPTARQPPVSLHNLLNTLSQQDRLATLSIPQRVRLAKSLSIGFLRHHTTDWGRPAWQCHRIFFFDVCCDVKSKPLQLPSPHVSALVYGPNGTPPSQPSNMPTIAGARNPQLFYLGLLLIEIAHLMTWEDLKSRFVQGTRENETPVNDLLQIKRLSESRLSLMPGQYHDVAERLIEGRLSCGHDLSKLESQLAFYQQVIDPLESLEDEFQRMKFAI